MRLHDTGSPFENVKKLEADFIKWYRAHSIVPKDKDPKEELSDETLLSKFNVTVSGNTGDMFINCGWKLHIRDHTIERLPFKFGKCSQMHLDCNKLATLEGTPVECNMFTLESTAGANNVLTSMANGPQHAEHIAIQIARPLENMQTGLKSPIESLWIHAPSVNSFAGLNVHVDELMLNLPFQKSVSGIHKQLKNVDTLALVLDPAFEGGVLSLAMIKGLKRLTGPGGTRAAGRTPDYERAFAAINAGLTQGWNVHELQEKMIDAGLGKFARL